jgi:hypothetical protein
VNLDPLGTSSTASLSEAARDFGVVDISLDDFRLAPMELFMEAYGCLTAPRRNLRGEPVPDLVDFTQREIMARLTPAEFASMLAAFVGSGVTAPPDR